MDMYKNSELYTITLQLNAKDILSLSELFVITLCVKKDGNNINSLAIGLYS